MYTAIGQNWTLSFGAYWTHGNYSGKAVQNATVTVQVTSTTKNKLITNLSLKTTTGIFAFNYSSATADILKFNVTKLVTEDGKTYDDSAVFDGENGVFGLQSQSVSIWWDTFNVSLVNSNTETSGITTVTVNVTYLLLPEEGLTLPDGATYSNHTFLPKIVHGANVTINGVEAKESSMPGIYTASFPCWFPTTYIHVGVSEEGWATTHTGFSFAQNANTPFWTYGALIASTFILVIFGLRYVSLRKTKRPEAFKQSFPFFGGVLLAIASIISLYWTLVGIDSTLHGFGWSLLALMELISSGVGLAGAVFSLKRKNQAFVLCAIILPLILNLVLVRASLESYMLPIPWANLTAALAIAIASAFLISNADEQFR
jgi:hypothetical protein